MKHLQLLTFLALLLTACGTGKEYELVRRSQDPGPYETFLLKHPKSKYAEDAKIRLNAARQIAEYKRAKAEQSIGLYEAFVKDHPASKITPLAQEELLALKEARDWQIAINTDEVYQYRLYLNTYPETTHKAEAEASILALAITRQYKEATAADTQEALRSFIEKFPEDERVPAAEARIQRLQETAGWLRAMKLNTSTAYREFYTNYPAAPEVVKARSEEERMVEEELFNEAKSTGTLTSYKSYLARYPTGRYATRVRKQVEELEVHGPAWRRAESLNTIEGYNAFADQHAGSEKAGESRSRAYSMQREQERRTAEAERERVARAAQAEAARQQREADAAEAQRLKKIRDELNLFERAGRNKSKRDYQRYVQTYPSGRYVDEANEAIIDLEVAEIFRGDHGVLPPMQRSSYGAYSASTSIKVQNETQYTLTVRYSGPSSKKIEIPRGGSKSFSLTSGSYKITASVSARNVQNYAGSESLRGGEYSSKFYIETSTGYGRY